MLTNARIEVTLAAKLDAHGEASVWTLFLMLAAKPLSRRSKRTNTSANALGEATLGRR